MENSKYPKEYTEKDIGFIKDPFQPEFRYDSRGRFIMPLPGYSKTMLAVEPGSRNIGQSTEDEAGNPQVDPSSLKTGYLHATTALIVGPKDGWVVQLAGGDAKYPISYFNEATKVMNFYVDKEGNVYLKGKLIAGADSEVDWSYLKNISVLNAHIGEVLTIGNTEAKTTYVNSDFKDMAFEALVEASKLGLTIVDGGYLQTILIDAQYIQAGVITGRTVRTGSSGSRIEMVDHEDVSWPDTLVFYDLNENSVMDIRGGAGQGIFEGVILFPSGVGTSRAVGFEGPFGYVSLEIWEDSLKARHIVPLSSAEDLGSVANKWRYLFLGSTPTQDYHAATKGYVDSVAGAFTCTDLAACSLSNLGIRPHSQLTNINSGDHHTRYANSEARAAITGYIIYPLSIQIGGSAAYTIHAIGNMYITSGIKAANVDLGYTNSYDILPYASDYGSVGYQTRHWDKIYANTYYSDYDEYLSFQKHDDIKLIKAIKIKTVKGKEVWNLKALPKEIFSTNKKMVKTEAMSGFLIGTLKQLIEKVEQLEK